MPSSRILSSSNGCVLDCKYEICAKRVVVIPSPSRRTSSICFLGLVGSLATVANTYISAPIGQPTTTTRGEGSQDCCVRSWRWKKVLVLHITRLKSSIGQPMHVRLRPRLSCRIESTSDTYTTQLFHNL
ncbi:hypothetical protein BDW66DRAFT_4867 [Aspergillus desertorum]